MNKFFDLERIIASKNPKLLKRMPGFVLRYLKRITHEDEINVHMLQFKELRGKAFCTAIINEFNISVNTIGMDHIPREGACIFVCNHPLGGMDALAIVHEVHAVRPDIKFIVNDVLMNVENLKGMFQGVNKHGATAKESLKKIGELFETDQAIFIFPAGLVSRRKKGVVKDLEWKKTFISQAKRNKTPVVPVYLDGQLSNFFYRLSNIRSFFGLKANIEMLYLADETFRQKNSTLSLVFGQAIPASTFDKSKRPLEWANWVKEKVYQLKEKI